MFSFTDEVTSTENLTLLLCHYPFISWTLENINMATISFFVQITCDILTLPESLENMVKMYRK
jgi:hypothetical protein